MLVSHAPATLNHAARYGETPLSLAAYNGNDGTVFHLLSLGASNKEVINSWMGGGNYRDYKCPLARAVSEGHEHVVRTLLDVGLEAVGGLSVIPKALCHAVVDRQPRILQRLISVEGEERRPHWARVWLEGTPLVHYAAGKAFTAGISVLLAVGADETVLSRTKVAGEDLIGWGIPENDRAAVEVAAVGRMLERAPAFRARSWTWPSNRHARTTSVVVGGGAEAAPSPSGAPRAPLDACASRPRNRKHFAKLVGR